jgi:hypothetical protein
MDERAQSHKVLDKPMAHLRPPPGQAHDDAKPTTQTHSVAAVLARRPSAVASIVMKSRLSGRRERAPSRGILMPMNRVVSNRHAIARIGQFYRT